MAKKSSKSGEKSKQKKKIESEKEEKVLSFAEEFEKEVTLNIKMKMKEKLNGDYSDFKETIQNYKKSLEQNKLLLGKIDQMNKSEIKEIMDKEKKYFDYLAKREFNIPLTQLKRDQLISLIKDNILGNIKNAENNIINYEKNIRNMSDKANLSIMEGILSTEQWTTKKAVELGKGINIIDPFDWDIRERKPKSGITDWNDKQSGEVLHALEPYIGKFVYLYGGSGAMGLWGDYEPVYLESVERIKIPLFQREKDIGKDMNEWNIVIVAYKLKHDFTPPYGDRKRISRILDLEASPLEIETSTNHLGSWRIAVLPDEFYEDKVFNDLSLMIKNQLKERNIGKLDKIFSVLEEKSGFDYDLKEFQENPEKYLQRQKIFEGEISLEAISGQSGILIEEENIHEALYSKLVNSWIYIPTIYSDYMEVEYYQKLYDEGKLDKDFSLQPMLYWDFNKETLSRVSYSFEAKQIKMENINKS